MKPVIGPIINLYTHHIHVLRSREELGLSRINRIKQIEGEIFYLFRDPDRNLWAQPQSLYIKYFSSLEHRHHKLSEDQVMDIFLSGSLYSVENLAIFYGVSAATIRNILQRRTWKKITKGYASYEIDK